MAADGSRLERIAASGAWLYLSMIANYAGGFAFWITAGMVLDAESMGRVGAAVGLGVLMAAIASLGVGTGLQRLVGRSLAEGESGLAKAYASSGLLLSLATSIAAASILVAGSYLFDFSGEGMGIAGVAAVLTILVAVSQSCWGYLVGAMDTRRLFLFTALGQSVRVASIVVLSVAGALTWSMAGLSYAAQPVAVIAAGWAAGCLTLAVRPLRVLAREVLVTSLPSWIPNTILLAGQWLGVLAVYSVAGGVDTGVYYIGYVVFTALAGPAIAVTSMLLPALSSGGSQRVADEAIRLSLAISAPLAAAAVYAPELVPAVFGAEYAGVVDVLPVLAASYPAVVVFQGVYSYVYALGRLRAVLALGLAQNIPRLALYLLLVPRMGALGSALAFTVGAYTGLALAVAMHRGSRLDLLLYSALSYGVPLAAGYVLDLVLDEPLLSAIAIPAVSYPVYIAIKLLGIREVKAIIERVLAKIRL